MHGSEKWKGSCSVMSDYLQPHGPQPTRLLCPWDFPGKSTVVGCHCLLRSVYIICIYYLYTHSPFIRERYGNALQYSCLENPVDRGAWWAAVHRVTQSWTRLKQLSMHACMHWRRKWQPTPVFLPRECQGWRTLIGCCLWGHTELDMTEVT